MEKVENLNYKQRIPNVFNDNTYGANNVEIYVRISVFLCICNIINKHGSSKSVNLFATPLTAV